MQHDPAHELYVEMPLSQGSLGGLADGCEGVRQHVVQRLALDQPFLEPVGTGAQFGIEINPTV
jgi:hypothetical protein